MSNNKCEFLKGNSACPARKFIKQLFSEKYIYKIPQEVADTECHGKAGEYCAVRHFTKYDCEQFN